MSGGLSRKKKNPTKQNREEKNNEKEDMLAPEANMANFQSSLDGISKQIQGLHNEMKADLKAFKEDITAEMSEKLTEFREDIYQKLSTISAEMGEQKEKINAAATRTEEMEAWSRDANRALCDLLKEQKKMKEKLDDLESRSRRNNLRIYGIEEEAEATENSVVDFIDKWLKEEFSLNLDLQIQRAHRALAPKPRAGHPPRSIVICFQQFTVKDMILKKAWDKKTVMYGEKRIFFDHDYAERILQQRKAYVNIKKVLKREGIRFQTPFNKMRVHWPGGVVMYAEAEDATNDLRKRGYEVEDPAGQTREFALVEKLLSTGVAAWKPGRKERPEQAARRARAQLQEFERKNTKE